MMLVGLDEIRAAHARLAPYVLRSPLVDMVEAGVRLKAESLQRSGSFKLRGAFNSMLQLDADDLTRGVVAHSSGNHAIAVAIAGSTLGVPVVVVMPDDAPRMKLDATRRAGATVVVVGPSSSERSARAAELSSERGLTMIEPYDSAAVIAATATISVETLEDSEPVHGGIDLYVPVSGGGLAAGVATGAKLLDPSVRIVGVEPELAADALASRRAGHPVEAPAAQMARTIADGLRVQQVGALPWVHLEAYLDEIVTVSEDEIRAAMVAVAGQGRLVAEPSGATAAAAALDGRGGDRPPGSRVAVLTGGNVDPELFADVLRGSS